MSSISLTEALTRLAELINEAARRTIVIVSGDRAVRLTPTRIPSLQPRLFGSAAGRVHMREDFDAPLADFKDYQ